MTRFAIFVFALFMSGAMSVLNAQVEAPKEVQGDEDYINWESNPIEGGSNGFIVHPNGNLIMNHSNEFFEVDGKTGQLLRAFPVQYGFTDYINYTVSPDGKYFAYTLYGDSTVTFIIDYESGETYRRIRNLGQQVEFINNTQLLVDRYGSSMGIYTFGNDSTVTIFGTNTYLFGTSIDGKYIGSYLNAKESSNGPVYTWFFLWDAETHKQIKSIKFEEEMGVAAIKFSPDGKYVAFYSTSIYIYALPNFSLFRKYHNYGDFSFLGNDLMAFSSYTSKEGRTVSIRNLNDTLDSLLFIYKGNGGGGIGYSQALNSLYIRGNGLHSFNLTKIFANVSVEETNSTQISVDYRNGLLNIRNLSIPDNNTLAKIIDMQGNVVFQFPIAFSKDNSVSIPISLSNGAYILNFEKQTCKFLVLE